MQTFLPHPDFARSAALLDQRRLGKQRVEVLQVLRALHLPDYGWRSHPAVVMWRGHTAALVAYGLAVVEEWCARGHADTTGGQIAEFVHPDGARAQADLAASGELPPWLGWPALHRSHRSALVAKDPERYATAFPDTPADLPYVWPPPPADERTLGRWDAWALRGRVEGELVAIAAGELEAPDDLPGRRRTKRVRQLQRLADEVSPGDPVVVIDGDALRLGVVRSPYRHTPTAHTVTVGWVTELDRSSLTFPAALQDPQDVFALHDEPLVPRLLEGA